MRIGSSRPYSRFLRLLNNDLLKQDRAELLALSILLSYSLAI